MFSIRGRDCPNHGLCRLPVISIEACTIRICNNDGYGRQWLRCVGRGGGRVPGSL